MSVAIPADRWGPQRPSRTSLTIWMWKPGSASCHTILLRVECTAQSPVSPAGARVLIVQRPHSGTRSAGESRNDWAYGAPDKALHARHRSHDPIAPCWVCCILFQRSPEDEDSRRLKRRIIEANTAFRLVQQRLVSIQREERELRPFRCSRASPGARRRHWGEV